MSNLSITSSRKRVGTPIPLDLLTGKRSSMSFRKQQDVSDLSGKINFITPTFKTPLKSPHNLTLRDQEKSSKEPQNEEVSSVRKSDQTEMKLKTHRRPLVAEQAETEERKYYKLTQLARSQKSEMQEFSVSVKKEDESESQGSERKDSLSPEHSELEDKSETDRKSKTRKTKRMYEQQYVPNKRVKQNKRYYEDSVELYDKLREDYVEFRVFKESDLCNSKFIQNMLKDADADDDCPTDSEQLELAKDHVKKQLKQAVEIENDPEKSNSSTPTTSKRNSSGYSSQKAFSFTSSTVASEDLSEDLDGGSKTFNKVTKKLSYDEEDYCLTQRTPVPAGLKAKSYFDKL